MNRRLLGAALLGVPLLGLQSAAADEIRATSAIEAVLVFPSGADVTRTGEIRLPEGEHQVLFRGLPQYLDPASVRVRFGSDAVIVGAVEAGEAYPEDGGPEEARRLEDAQLAVLDQIQAVDDRIATAELQMQFLQGQTGLTAPDGDTVNPANWTTALAALDAGGRAARADILAARQERRALERRLQEIQLEVDRIASALGTQTDVQVTLIATEAVATALELTYHIEDAGWGALYDARLDSEASTLTLDRKIDVYQESGEDWTRVRLAVSTAPPTYELDAPYVDSLYLNLVQPAPADQDRDGGYARGDFTANTAITTVESEVFERQPGQNVDEYLSQLPQFTPSDFSFASTYEVGGLVDVLSDGNPRTFTIGQENFAVELAVRASPRTSLEAFVIAKLTYEGAGPLPPGGVRLYRDGAYLTSSYLATLIPSEEVEIGFGVDQQIIVTWVDEGGKQSESGLIGRSTQIAEDHRFEALNRHSTPFTVELVDYRPIAQDDDIQVRVSPESTPADETDFNDQPGVLLWRKELAPDETLTVRNAYTIVHPTSEILVGR